MLTLTRKSRLPLLARLAPGRGARLAAEPALPPRRRLLALLRLLL